MTQGFLEKSYGKSDPGKVREHYDAWAASYDAEISENGYATPGRCAQALAKFLKPKSTPILDFGCGTGLSGLALKMQGYDIIDGVDISADMLKGAKAKGLYRNLSQIEPNTPLTHTPGTYGAITAIGAIGAGAAPIAVIDTFMRGLARGGFLVLSLNDHALADPTYEGKLNEWLDCGAACLLFREHGPHLPGINLKSNVYVIEKA
jgi:predicted TPR repeat methyltransferase